MLSPKQMDLAIATAELYMINVDSSKFRELDEEFLDAGQLAAIQKLSGQSFDHKWQFYESLAAQTDAWKKKEATELNKSYSMQLKERLDYVYGIFRVLAPD